MPRGYKKNYKVIIAMKESRGGGTRHTGKKKSKRNSRRRFSPKGGQRHLSALEIKHDWQEMKQEKDLELKDFYMESSFMELWDDDSLSDGTAAASSSTTSSPSSHYHSSCASAPRELCDVEDNIAPLCNKECCRPPIIQGLQQLLLNEPQQQQQLEPEPPSYKDIAMIASLQDQYFFENLRIVNSRSDRRSREYDAYSEWLSFDSQGFAKYQPTNWTKFKRTHRGCSSCGYGAYTSYGFFDYGQDCELMVLPSLEFAVSSRLDYKPFRIQLQHLITAVYDWKDELYESNLDYSEPEEEENNLFNFQKSLPQERQDFVRELNNKCEWTTRRIAHLLKAYVSNEARAQSELSFLSLGVYKCHLQQLAFERDWGKEHLDKFLAGESGTLYEHVDWKSLQAFSPHNRLSSIGIIVQHVKPFLLDIC